MALAPVLRDDASAAFFDAASKQRLLLRRCRNCAHVRAPEVPMCTDCLSESFDWFDAAKTGTLQSWVVLHAKPTNDDPNPPAQIIATVELDEGPWMVSALINADAEELRAGLAVTVAFERPDGSEAIPVFTPVP